MEFYKLQRVAGCRGHGRHGLLTLLSLCLWAPAASALPLISELFYDAVGSDDGLSFVELYGLPGTDLSGFTLEGINGSNGAVSPTVTLSGVVPADGLFLVADNTSAGVTQVAGADLLANFDFQNGPDSVVLRDGSGALLDALAYGVFGASDVFAGEGSAAPDASAGSSLARVFANVDTDDNAVDFVVLEMPTPGVAATVVPEPGTGLLVASGVVGFAFRSQRNRSQRSRRAHSQRRVD